MKTFKEINESTKSEALATEFSMAIDKIDESMSYKDFAHAVSLVLKEHYGQHNFKPFMDELKKELK